MDIWKYVTSAMKPAKLSRPGIVMLARGYSLWICFAFTVLPGMRLVAQPDIRVESSKPVKSADGSRSIVVDHLIPVLDGEPERFSGKLLVRATDNAGTTTRQRYMETSQIRLIGPGKWLDERWFSFAYDVSKNSKGVVAFNSNDGSAIQVESVITSRRMGATGKIENEITDLEIADYGDTITRLRNVTRDQKSIFPLYIQDLGFLTGKNLSLDNISEIQNALSSYRELQESMHVQSLTLEEASESFNGGGTHMATLACRDAKPVVLIIPLNAPSAVEALNDLKLAELGDEIRLTCQSERDVPLSTEEGEQPETTPGDAAAAESEAATENEQFGGQRYTTSWKNDGTAQIEKEIFESEEESARRIPLYQFTIAGALKKLAVESTPTAAKHEKNEPARFEPDEKESTGSVHKTPKQQPAIKPGGEQSTPVTKHSERARTESSPQPRSHNAATPVATQRATPVASPTATSRPGFFRRMLPGVHRSSSTPEPRPTPGE
jgi:hypothetical protein